MKRNFLVLFSAFILIAVLAFVTAPAVKAETAAVLTPADLAALDNKITENGLVLDLQGQNHNQTVDRDNDADQGQSGSGKTLGDLQLRKKQPDICRKQFRQWFCDQHQKTADQKGDQRFQCLGPVLQIIIRQFLKPHIVSVSILTDIGDIIKRQMEREARK